MTDKVTGWPEAPSGDEMGLVGQHGDGLRLTEPYDDEFEALFSAFDDVSASNTLVEATLAQLGVETEGPALNARAVQSEAGPAETNDPVVNAETAVRENGESEREERRGDRAVQASAGAGQKDGASKGARANASNNGGKRGWKARFRGLRVAAVAACLSLALTGGAAYAMPASYVTVARGDANLTFGVNLFDITVSAAMEGDATADAGLNVTDLLHKPFGDSLQEALDSLAPVDPAAAAEPVQVQVQSGDEGQRDRLERESGQAIESRGFVAAPDGYVPEEAAPVEPAGQPGAQPPEEPTFYEGAQVAPQPGVQPDARLEAQADTQPEAESKVQPGVQSEAQPATQGSPEPPSASEAQTGEAPADQPDAQPEAKTGSQPEEQSVIPEAQPAGQPEADLGSPPANQSAGPQGRASQDQQGMRLEG